MVGYRDFAQKKHYNGNVYSMIVWFITRKYTRYSYTCSWLIFLDLFSLLHSLRQKDLPTENYRYRLQPCTQLYSTKWMLRVSSKDASFEVWLLTFSNYFTLFLSLSSSSLFNNKNRASFFRNPISLFLRYIKKKSLNISLTTSSQWKVVCRFFIILITKL